MSCNVSGPTHFFLTVKCYGRWGGSTIACEQIILGGALTSFYVKYIIFLKMNIFNMMGKSTIEMDFRERKLVWALDVQKCLSVYKCTYVLCSLPAGVFWGDCHHILLFILC